MCYLPDGLELEFHRNDEEDLLTVLLRGPYKRDNPPQSADVLEFKPKRARHEKQE